MTRIAARRTRLDCTSGRRYGTRVVTGTVDDGPPSSRVVTWRCDCGAEGTGVERSLARTRGCPACRTRRKPRDVDGIHGGSIGARPEITEELRAMRGRAPEVWLSDDPASREAVRELAALLPPLSLAEIGVLLGVSRERARQLEMAALRRLEARLRMVGIREAGEQDGAGWTYPEGGP